MCGEERRDRPFQGGMIARSWMAPISRTIQILIFFPQIGSDFPFHIVFDFSLWFGTFVKWRRWNEKSGVSRGRRQEGGGNLNGEKGRREELGRKGGRMLWIQRVVWVVDGTIAHTM